MVNAAPSMICTWCNSITLRSLRLQHKHAPGFKALKAMSKTCDLCGILWSAVASNAGSAPCNVDLLTVHEYPVILQARYEKYTDRLTGIDICSHGEDADLRFPGRVFGMVCLFVSPCSPAAGLVAGREIYQDLGCAENMRLIGSWIVDCATKHSQCSPIRASILDRLPYPSGQVRPQTTAAANRRLSETPLPLRVIDVGPVDGSKEPYLLDLTARPRISGPYIALSHCWGGSRTLTTTSKNWVNHIHKIPISTLPPTFRDAVLITRLLGTRFLWIDSLCIIQDDQSDWKYHCERMGAIFGLSFLTISAASSPNSQGGLFSATFGPSPPHCIITPKDLSCNLHVRSYIEEIPFSITHPGFTDARAWCFQETALPERVLTFGKTMVGLLCNKTRINPQGYEIGQSIGLRIDPCLFLVSQFRLLGWATILSNYTPRELSFGKDKLVAIGGVAALIGNLMKDKYMAGIWESHSVDGLLWWTDGNDRSKRSTEYRAPSWSWACLDGRVHYPSISSASDERLARLISWKVDYVDDYSFGEVRGGFIQLSAPMLKVSRDGEAYVVTGAPLLPSTKNRLTEDIMECLFDVAEEKVPGELWCLGMTSGRPNLNAFFSGSVQVPTATVQGFGLLLTPTLQTETFSRVGLARLKFPIFSGVLGKVITVI